MADGERSAIGLSVGATNLVAVTADRAVTRKPVLTLYRQRPPEVGVPSENPKLNEPGLVITDFVDRVGNPVGVVAADGSTHRSEALLADALRALAYTATGGRALPDAAAVTYPAHWRSAAVDALDASLSRVSEWSNGRLSLLPDSTAALLALQADPGVPPRGIIPVCDFGGSGTSITFINAEEDYLPVGPTLRHADLSGDLVDQALLNHVLADLSAAGSFDTSRTSAIGSLTRLRAECRAAKEQLSSSTETTLTAELPGFRGDVRLTRTELDDAIRQPLGTFLAVLQEALERTGNRVTDLSAIGAVGGGASVPAVTTRLSEYFQVPVITAPRPHLTQAIGAALRASRGQAGDSETALASTAAAFMPPTEAVTTSAVDLEPSVEPALAWSEADDDSDIMPVATGEYPTPADEPGAPPIQPLQQVDREAGQGETHPAATAWYRRPALVILGVALAVLAVAAAIVIGLTSGGGPTAPAPSVSTTPAPGSSAPGSSQSSSSTGSATTSAPSSTQTTTTTQPSSSTQTTTTTQPSSSTQTTTTTQPSSSTQTSTTQSTTSQPTIPPVPRFIPRPEPRG